MKVLFIHNRYKILGGEDLSTEAEVALLKCNGIEVDTLFVSNENIEAKNKIGLAINTIWSRHYYRKILEKVKDNQYDIVHVQNFFPQFSPSIFYALQKAKTKVVMSVRNYRLICPNAILYVNGKICKDCVGKMIPTPAITKKCYRKNLATSTAVVSMLSFHNFLNTWKTKIDGYICVSEFVKSQLMLGGFDDHKLHVKYNFVSAPLSPNFENGLFYIYAGRLSEEKGIDILIRSFTGTTRKLVIVGDGPLKTMVELAASQNPNIIYLGRRPLQEIYELISKATALIFPSKWHEPFGRTIVEAFAQGTPVIASAMGGIPELIKDHYNGILFDPYLADGLQKAITEFEGIDDNSQIRHNSYESYRQEFLPSTNFSRLIDIYQKVLSA